MGEFSDLIINGEACECCLLPAEMCGGGSDYDFYEEEKPKKEEKGLKNGKKIKSQR